MLKPGYPIKPVAGNYFMYFRYVKKYPGWIRNRLSYAGLLNPNTSVKNIPGGRMILPQPSANKFNLELNKKYELSFSSILVGQPALWRFWTIETIEPGTDISAPKLKYQEVSGTITPSSTWVKRSLKFKCPSMVQSNQNYNFFFRVPKGECKFLVDNLSLKEISK